MVILYQPLDKLAPSFFRSDLSCSGIPGSQVKFTSDQDEHGFVRLNVTAGFHHPHFIGSYHRKLHREQVGTNKKSKAPPGMCLKLSALHMSKHKTAPTLFR
jgi:hypothetical protein